MSNPIYITKPAMPPLRELYPYLEKIWENQILTNSGSMHQELEKRLCEYLGVQYISLFNNATIALMLALKALDLKGEVITTPFTFIATSEALLWNQLKPVFVDIESKGFNIDPKAIEAAITENTCAILPVHCYGHPCQVREIERIAKAYDLKVIYDAAHAFGVKDELGSILNYGDLSILSFHATKVFNTFEGGAIVSHSLEMKKKIDSLKNFGIQQNLDIGECGLNGKLNEISAAFGLLYLDYIPIFLEKRKKLFLDYYEFLSRIDGVKCFQPTSKVYNYAYFPILIEENFSVTRDELYERLLEKSIFVRRYFYPLMSEYTLFSEFLDNSKDLKNAKEKTDKILCLPLYPDLTQEEQMRVIDFLKSF